MNHSTDRDQQIREESFLLMVPLFAAAGLLWSFLYFFYGARNSALIPGGYAIIAFSSLLLYRWRRNFKFFRSTQLVLILLLPFLLHLSLGDFTSSSAVILWSALCPLGALAFQNSKAAIRWMLLFVSLVILAFFLEKKVFSPESLLPQWLISLLFVMNISGVAFLGFFVLRYFVTQNQQVKEQLKQEQALLAAEREKSESLLLNILPASIAKRLKGGETIIADEYPQAAILFADLVGFTKTTQSISPALMVDNLNKIFTHFDKLVEQFGLEKIKTIGDSYMVVSGLDKNKQVHFFNIADLGLNMLADISNFSLNGNERCNVRIGIHSGPVVAGVIGSKKFTYDVWGDTVNTASRMERYGEPGKIQVSEKFYQQLKDRYTFEYRGQTEIKSKGMMNLYFLTGKSAT